MFGRHESIVNRLGYLQLTIARRWSRGLAATLFPPRCCLCGFPGASVELDLCAFCHADLPWTARDPQGGIVPLRFEYPVDDMIRQLKYHGAIAQARVLGTLLAQAVRKCAAPLPNLLVPVPLHGARVRERGFNQAFALARYAGRMLEVPFARNLVRRVRDTPSQTALDLHERRRNVSGAFALGGARAQESLVAAGHVAVIDDVMTTGSTVEELRGVLLAAGVAQVDVWAVARAR